MGYLCPVCKEPFGGGGSLANHLAVTAILHGGDHEAWLDKTVVNWGAIPRADLADHVVDHAESADDHDHPGDHAHIDLVSERSGVPEGVDTAVNGGMSRRPSNLGPFSAADTDALDPEARAILEEATAYTRAMVGEGDSEPADPDAEGKES
jgi:hypothetical protein